ncbi:MAG: zf-HC2 domain-containing protein [Solirubrobacteraceae bacterium]
MVWPRSELVCQQAVELISDYIEGALTRSQRKRLEGHLAGCEHCDEYVRQMRMTIRLTGRVVAEDLPPQMRQDLVLLYRRWREQGA